MSAVSKVVGIPTRFAWSQVHAARPEEAKLATHGQLICTLSLDLEGQESGGSSQTPVVDIGHELLTRLNEEYYGKETETGSPFRLLKKAISSLAQEFSANAALEVTGCVLWQNFVYFCSWGPSRVYLWRDLQLSPILLGRDGQVGSCSGQHKEGDIFLFATSAFFLRVDRPILLKCFTSNVVQDIADNIAPFAHRAPSPTLGAAVVKIVEEKEEKEEQLTGELVNQEEVSSKPQDSEQVSVGLKAIFAKNLKVGQVLRKVKSKIAWLLSTPQAWTPESFRKRRTAVSVGLILLALLLASIGFGIQQKKVHEYKASYEDKLQEAQSAYSDSLLQKDINAPLARQLFNRAKEIADSLDRQGIKDSRLDSLEDHLRDSAPGVLGRVEDKPILFLDLSLVRSPLQASQIALDKDNLVILDQGGQRMILVSLTKETSVWGGAEKIKNASFVGISGLESFVFDATGVTRFDKRGSGEVVIKADSAWNKIVGMEVFGSNIYLFDNLGKIWRYGESGGAFGAKQDWLKSSLELTNVQDASIDGSIWILFSDGGVKKLTRGSVDSFRIEGLQQKFSSPQAIYTNADLESIYILDKSNSRIVEITKSGQFKKEYINPDLGSVLDFVVSKQAGKIFLLTESKILTLDLK